MNTNALSTLTESAPTLDISRIKNAALRAEAESLSALHSQMLQPLASAAKTIEDIRRKQAVILDRIQSTKLYEKDGFKSLADFATSIGLEKSNAHALASAGRVYNDKTAPKALKNMSPSKLATLSSSLKDDDSRKQVYANAEIVGGMTQAELKEYAKDLREEKPRKVKTYRAYVLGSTVNYIPDNVANPTPNNNYTLGQWHNYFEALDFEVIDLPKGCAIGSDTPTINRMLTIAPDNTLTVYLFIEFKESSKTKTAKKNSTPSTTPRENYIKRAIAAGQTVDEINVTCNAMGWDAYVPDDTESADTEPTEPESTSPESTGNA